MMEGMISHLSRMAIWAVRNNIPSENPLSQLEAGVSEKHSKSNGLYVTVTDR